MEKPFVARSEQAVTDSVAALLQEKDEEIARLTAELAAYKRAKEENDDRFMGERDAARHAVILLHEACALLYQAGDWLVSNTTSDPARAAWERAVVDATRKMEGKG
jgi:hypothetical protein